MSTTHNTATNTNQLPLSMAFFTAFLCMLFGANAVAIKVSLTGIGAFATVGLRFTIAASALLIWAKWKNINLTITKKQFYQLAVISFIFFVQMSCFYHGQGKTTASHGTLIANILPFVVMVLAHFFLENDRITRQKIIGLICGFTGVAILFWDSATASNAESLSGDLSILFAVLLWGCNVTIIKHIIPAYQPIQITLFPMIFTIPFFFCGAVLWDGEIVRFINLEIVAAMLYQSLVTASFGFVMWNTLIQRYGATALHSFIFIMPVSGVFFGVILLDEPFSARLMLSIALVTLGLVVVNYHLKTASNTIS